MPEGRPFRLVRSGAWLVAHFDRFQRTASWAICGGGLWKSRTVAWLEVSDRDLRPPVDARRFLHARLSALGDEDAVGLLTSRSLDAFTEASRSDGALETRCVATVGLGNALRAGDPPGKGPHSGTINILCHVSAPLSDEALLEALALCAEARALAVREAEVTSTTTGKPASGTGTDCIVVAAPEGAEPIQHVGKHTVVGHLIGHVVHEAVRRGVEQWNAERAGRTRALGEV
ncbi:MAG: adenosylcobinamide amidohydrolase [Deltaproteobacteria bacterium]|nr:adenosylcobinamide amidohydrolase [Deltaproteobacteria bacterium]